MNPLIILPLLLWSSFALATPAPLPDELAEEAGMLGSLLSDGRAVFYPDSASYLPLSSLSGPGYSNGVAVLMSLGGWGGGATNNQYLALYAVNDSIAGIAPVKTYRLLSFTQVGGKGERLFTDVQEGDKGLVLTGFSYTGEDPLCCPSKPLKVIFTIGTRGELAPADKPGDA
ncbi:hypothetical protein [Marinobacter daepoensis]|uniref:hypothetical protein n=1 Tax=Marinobacter daepoensis TaxID=262077 RepID=UPI00040809ED|nr:hypothetical protein [Marinobacter daepoensis]